jgi:hypothetical protein
MTPTLLGRWQIRFFLLATVGLVISLIVSQSVGNTVPLFALLYVLLFGLVWDVIYQFITSFRWDRDWPTCFQVAAGVVEGALVWGLILTKKLPGVAEPPPFIVFLIQYGAIWLSIFVLTQGPLRVIWLKWRYQGGQWFVSRSVRAEVYSYQQQPVPELQVVRAGNPDRLLSPGDLTVLQPVQAYACACGFAFDRAAGNFCPRCGRPKVQQGVS